MEQRILPAVVELVRGLVSFSHVHIQDLSEWIAVELPLRCSKQNSNSIIYLSCIYFFQTANPCIFIIKK